MGIENNRIKFIFSQVPCCTEPRINKVFRTTSPEPNLLSEVAQIVERAHDMSFPVLYRVVPTDSSPTQGKEEVEDKKQDILFQQSSRIIKSNRYSCVEPIPSVYDQLPFFTHLSFQPRRVVVGRESDGKCHQLHPLVRKITKLDEIFPLQKQQMACQRLIHE